MSQMSRLLFIDDFFYFFLRLLTCFLRSVIWARLGWLSLSSRSNFSTFSMRSTFARSSPNSRPSRDKVLLSSCTSFALFLVSLTGSLTSTSSSCVISLLKFVNSSEYFGSRYYITSQFTFLFSIFLKLFSCPNTIFKKEVSSTGSLLQILLTLNSNVEMRLYSILSQNCYRFLVAKPLQMDMVVYQFYTVRLYRSLILSNLLKLIIKQREGMRHDRNVFQLQASDKENHDRSAVNFMRDNIRELNRSMESIEKMIEKSRRLIHQSREASLGRSSLEKGKDNRREGALLESGRKNNQEIAHGAGGRNEKKAPVYRQINLKKNNNAEEKSAVGNEKKQNVLIRSQQDHRKQEREMVSSKSKERSRIESPFKQTFEHGKAIYKFSPQRTQNLHFRQSKSKQKSPDHHPNIKIKSKPIQAPIEPSKPQHSKIQTAQKAASNIKENILIEQQEASNQYNTPNPNRFQQKQYRFKTDYTCQESTDIYKMYKLDQPQSTFQPKQERRKINLKLFQSDIKKSCLVSQRSKKSTIQSIKLSTRKNLVRQLQQLQTASKNDQERKAKFILKIKKYGFVEKHLSQQQIWSIYDQLIQANVPQLKWPIVIVDQVYSKMKMYK